jgi:hypothetical protein
VTSTRRLHAGRQPYAGKFERRDMRPPENKKKITKQQLGKPGELDLG